MCADACSCVCVCACIRIICVCVYIYICMYMGVHVMRAYTFTHSAVIFAQETCGKSIVLQIDMSNSSTPQPPGLPGPSGLLRRARRHRQQAARARDKERLATLSHEAGRRERSLAVPEGQGSTGVRTGFGPERGERRQDFPDAGIADAHIAEPSLMLRVHAIGRTTDALLALLTNVCWTLGVNDGKSDQGPAATREDLAPAAAANTDRAPTSDTAVDATAPLAAVALLQRFARRVIAARRRFSRNSGARRIQAHWRGCAARALFRTGRSGAVRLQALWRGHSTRCRLQDPLSDSSHGDDGADSEGADDTSSGAAESADVDGEEFGCDQASEGSGLDQDEHRSGDRVTFDDTASEGTPVSEALACPVLSPRTRPPGHFPTAPRAPCAPPPPPSTPSARLHSSTLATSPCLQLAALLSEPSAGPPAHAIGSEHDFVTKADLVEAVKEVQRSDMAAWSRYVIAEGKKHRDPIRHEKSFLAAFLNQHRSAPSPVRIGDLSSLTERGLTAAGAERLYDSARELCCAEFSEAHLARFPKASKKSLKARWPTGGTHLIIMACGDSWDFGGYALAVHRKVSYDGVRYVPEIHIDQLAIAEGMRRVGFGRILLGFLCQSHRRWTTLWCHQDLSAFYTFMSFRRAEPPCDDVVLDDDHIFLAKDPCERLSGTTERCLEICP